MAKDSEGSLGFNAAWSMAVGGMIGGGIFATLGVVIQAAGEWAWASFLIGGLIALATGHSYAALTVESGKPGGIYRFLRELDHGYAARIAAWVLILGYTLTVSVYAFTFGAYLANALGGPAWLPQAMAAVSIIALAGVNLMGVGEASTLEIVAVWGKLVILAGLAAFGLAQWNAGELVIDQPPGIVGALIGAGTVFMAYEGFQLLAYDYDEMKDRETLMPRVMPAAILTALAVYIAVALGTPMLIGADAVIEQREVALATAGRAALGTTGFVAVTIAAAFSTASAINATLFATARLARSVAEEGELPGIFGKTDREGVPYAGIMLISAVALALALVGGLGDLVKGASVIFLIVFGLVNAIAIRRKVGRAWIAWAGCSGAALAAAILLLHQLGFI
ncbi:APC family permease [Parasphingopyxis marina]|uniref:Amino acid permease n=1 Tax=Parasphingopyxis marina TaxID=2761622 RepID=A0A842I0K0_9SPHN|nr:APC family permease [Parasphingopyxis marina]MBC2777700.1 amino acid permease [Parasphingopyxis marina]